MRLRRRYVPLIAVLGAAAAVLPAVASSETSPTVDAVNTIAGAYSEEQHSWSPAQVSIDAGGIVTFRNSTEVPHGIEWRSPVKPTCEEGAGKVPVGTTAAASGTNWSGNCTFAQAGAYIYYCTVHGAAMSGTVTVAPGGATTVTTTPPPTTTGTTPPPKEEKPSTSPFVGGPSLRAVQHGGTVHGSIGLSSAAAGDRLEVTLLASKASLAKTGHSARVTVGRFTRSSVHAGRLSFSVKLSAKARRALKRRHRLALTVRIALVPFYGETTAIARSVVLHP